MTNKETDPLALRHGEMREPAHDPASSFRGVIELYNSYSFHPIDRTSVYVTVADVVECSKEPHGACRTATFFAITGL